VELQRDEILERLTAEWEHQKVEGEAAVQAFIRATAAFRQTFLLNSVRTYLKADANKAFGYLDEARRFALRDDVLKFIETDPQRVRMWLDSVSWPHRKKLVRETEREFNKPSQEYSQLEVTIRGLTDGLALILKKHGVGQMKDTETVRKLLEAADLTEIWSADMNTAWNTIEKVKKKVTEIDRERDDRLALLEREKSSREIDELFLGTPAEVI